jgi:hypothetical protein
MTNAVGDTSREESASILEGRDVIIVDEAVSSNTKTKSDWKDAESSTYEPLCEERHLDTSDTATTYSLDSSTNDSNAEYLQAFAEQLAKDLKVGSISTKLSNVPPSYISEALRMFTWRLHEESKDPFQWGISVALNQKREYAMFLTSSSFQLLRVFSRTEC